MLKRLSVKNWYNSLILVVFPRDLFPSLLVARLVFKPSKLLQSGGHLGLQEFSSFVYDGMQYLDFYFG